VIVPAYNAAVTLPACLAAIVAHPGESREIIVVNDGSTDGTARIAKEAGALVVEQQRQGPAAARNAGALLAKGDVLVFIDADVLVHPGAIDRMIEALEADPELAAIFGSYDSTPRVRGMISRYRNLLHAYTHQKGAEDASTFWAGLGAVRRQCFEEIGGFDSRKFETASIEDIEFGVRLKDGGRKIRLDRNVLGTHCKEWTLSSMVLTDLWCRAVPWTRLLRHSSKFPDDLNLRWSQRLSVAAAWFLPVSLAMAPFDVGWTPLPLVVLAFHMTLNARFYQWAFSHAGTGVLAASIALHILFHWVAGLGFLIGNLTSSPAEAGLAAPRGAART